MAAEQGGKIPSLAKFQFFCRDVRGADHHIATMEGRFNPPEAWCSLSPTPNFPLAVGQTSEIRAWSYAAPFRSEC